MMEEKPMPIWLERAREAWAKDKNSTMADWPEEQDPAFGRINKYEYDMHSEVGIKFQDLLADWAVGKVSAFEVWDFVKDNITKEKK